MRGFTGRSTREVVLKAERHRQIDRVFQKALAHGAAERTVFLDEACSDDPDLRREVEALLVSDEALATVIAFFLLWLSRKIQIF